MPKHNLRTIKEEDVIKEQYVFEEPKPKKNVETVSVPKIYKSVPIRLRIDANYKVTGQISGRGYLFSGAGSVVDVDERDVELILTLRRGKGCCGGGGANLLFELAED